MKQVTNSNYSSYFNTGISNYSSSVSSAVISQNIIPVVAGADDGSQTLLAHGKYSVYEIANWFLSKESMTHKKLQKLCYYAQAWNYALKDFRLIDSDFQAWVHGPVSPALYERFKDFGYDVIKMTGAYSCHIENEDKDMLESVWATYGGETGNSLEALSHRELPWIEARRGYAEGERCSVVISPSSMREFYKSIYIGK